MGRTASSLLIFQRKLTMTHSMTKYRQFAGVKRLRRMRMLFAALCLCSGAASATDCTMSLSSAQIDYGSLSRAELKTTLRPVSLGKRQLVLIVTCRQPQPFSLQFDAEPAGGSGYKFSRGGYYTVDIKQASVDGVPALPSASVRANQSVTAGSDHARLVPHESVSVLGQNGRLAGKALRVQIEIETYVDDATTRVRDVTLLEGMGKLRLVSF